MLPRMREFIRFVFFAAKLMPLSLLSAAVAQIVARARAEKEQVGLRLTPYIGFLAREKRILSSSVFAVSGLTVLLLGFGAGRL